MEYSISQVAKFSGVSARTLRHYDTIGLLRPSSVGGNGYRWYDRGQLLRLQRILVLRGLGLRLEKIAEVLAEETDEVAALRGHLSQVEAERARLDQVIGTIRSTVADLEQARTTDPARFFTGLREDRPALTARSGEETGAFRETAQSARSGPTATHHQRAAAQGAALFGRLAETMRAGIRPDEPAALDAIAEHHTSVLPHWQPSADAYAAMGEMYRTDPRQRSLAARADRALPDWLAEAIEAYARQRLA